jgi:hypothetical protein
MLRWQSDREDHTLIIRKAAQSEEMAVRCPNKFCIFGDTIAGNIFVPVKKSLSAPGYFIPLL